MSDYIDILLTALEEENAALRRENAIFHLNPGSVSIPKEGSGHGFLLEW